jgi:predicted alpha/beta hydrolase
LDHLCRRLSEYAARSGFATLTLDYRGIGGSTPSALKGFAATYLDWACLDLAAAVDAMASDTASLFMVGHSFGGHAFGLLPNHDRVARFFTGASAGSRPVTWGRLPTPTESIPGSKRSCAIAVVRMLQGSVLP